MKTKLMKTLSLILALVMMLSLAACGSGSEPANNANPAPDASTPAPSQGSEPGGEPAGDPSQDPKVTIKWASSVAQAEFEANKTPGAIAMNTWIDTVEEASGGSIEVEIHLGSTLASGTDATISGLLTGSFEMAQLNTGSWGDYTDAFTALNVPYLYTDYSLVHAVMDSEFGQEMLAQVEQDVNVKTLCYSDLGYRHVTNSKGPITSPADMKGLKIRTMTDPIQISAFEDLGCSVTPLPISELFSAMQTKMVDAQENPLTTIYNNKFQEVQSYCTLTRHSYTTTLFFMNIDFYNSLTDNQKAAIDAANEACTAASRNMLAEAEAEYQTLLEDAGMEFYTLSDEEMAAFQEAVAPTWKTVEEMMGSEKWDKLMAVVDAAK